MNKYLKGAEWRVWDLQIQTILDDRYESLDKYYQELKTADPAKWDTYVALVGSEENALLFDTKEYFGDHSKAKKERCTNYVRNTFAFLEIYKPHLGVIGITDHNYNDDTLIDEFFKYSKSTKCQVVCGVEINVGGIHILVFFDKPPYEKSTFSEGIKTFLSKIDVDHSKTNGVLTLSPKSCQDVMKEVKNSDGIFMFPHCNSSNGLFQERTKSDRTHLSDIFNHFPSIILQSNSRDSIEKVASYIKANPVLFKSKAIFTTASDARSLRDFGNADSDGHYLWIKGDPNFEGLKQISFEPLTRVRIDKDLPEKKQSYLVIDKVRFITSEEDLDFPKYPIEINDKMNGIIGGKSSGKSIILYYIAKTIDPSQVDRKIKDSGIDISYDFEKNTNFDFEVTWADGEVYTLRNNVVAKSRQITYVPQMFINYLAEKGGQNELWKLIHEILEQKPLFKALYDAQIQIINDHKIKLSTGLESYYQIVDQLDANESALKAKGDRKAREDNIKQKNTEIDDLRKKSGFSEQQELEYQTLKDLQNIYLKRFTNLSSLKYAYENDYLPHLKSTKQAIQPSLTNVHNNVVGKNLSTPLISSFFSKDIKSDNEKINKAFDELILKAEKRIERVETLLALNEDRLTVFRDLLAPYVAKIQNQEKLEELNQTIVNEQLILNGIYELETVKINLILQKDTLKINFLDAYKVIYEAYLAIADIVNSNTLFSEISSEKGIVLSSKIEFDTHLFSDTTISLINSQGYLSTKIGNYIDSGNNLIFEPSTHLQNISDFFGKIQNHEEHGIRFNRGGDTRTVSKKLFQDLFVIKYELSQNKESILKMSPGKKGMILLFLILHLSNAEYPILIDQPEDNLDNRTVYKELKEFIKEKKIQRQIIIVTHNANLVVPTDSENIIIANQNGQDSSKDNEKYRFEYITGSLENSFMNPSAIGILNKMGVKEHVCDILEGGTEAFKEREQKYDLT